MPRVESRPKYRVIQDLIRARIEDGGLAHGAKLPSEHDMARESGVAYMTVRTAVNALVAEGLLKRIHGKGTFVAAPSARLANTRTLALVVPSLPQLWNVAGLYYFPAIVQGFCAEATQLGFEPTVIGRSKDAFGVAREMAGLAGAACLLVCREDGAAVEGLRDLNIPVVSINAYPGRRCISYVAADQAGGMAGAVRTLAARGHRRIAFLPGPPDSLGARERLRGFQRGMAAQNLEPVPVDMDMPEYTDASGYVRTRALLSRSDPPTAIMTAGDLIAAGVLQAVREAGLSVPEEISVVGFGDFHIALHLQPALTTVRLPLAELGSEAAALLSRHVAGAGKRQITVLNTEMVERGSVAPPRGG